MQHLVVFKFDPLKFIDEFGNLSSLQAYFDELRSYIPGVNYIEIKEKHPFPFPSFHDGSGGWTHVLLSGHISPDDLKVYAEHPQHRALQSRMAKCMLAPPIRIEMNDPKQIACVSSCVTGCCCSVSFPHSSPSGYDSHGRPLDWIQEVVLFKFNQTALEDEFGDMEHLRTAVAQLQCVNSNSATFEIKAKNPEPWPRYDDASAGYTHVWIGNYCSSADVTKLQMDENRKHLWKRLNKISVAPPLEIFLATVP